MTWWSEYYNKPLKDPVLQSYTLEELAYEYYLHSEIAKAREEQAKAEADRIEEEKISQAEAWADEMEREEEEQFQRQQIQAPKPKTEEKPKEDYDPMQDPKNLQWMEEEIKKHKLVFGDDFGEDLSVDFESDD